MTYQVFFHLISSMKRENLQGKAQVKTFSSIEQMRWQQRKANEQTNLPWHQDEDWRENNFDFNMADFLDYFKEPFCK